MKWQRCSLHFGSTKKHLKLPTDCQQEANWLVTYKAMVIRANARNPIHTKLVGLLADAVCSGSHKYIQKFSSWNSKTIWKFNPSPLSIFHRKLDGPANGRFCFTRFRILNLLLNRIYSNDYRKTVPLISLTFHP